MTIQSSSPKLQAASRSTIWIDLDNSPHVLLFNPIIREMEKRGHRVLLTGRDCFQVPDLVEDFKLDCKLIGRHYGKNFFLKLYGLGLRALQLLYFVCGKGANVAVSHGSRSQIVAAWLLRIPSVLILDYEHARALPFPQPTLRLMPEVVYKALEAQGSSNARRPYPGIKEDVYVPDFRPDPSILEKLGVRRDELLVTVRPPATEAHYHNPESEGLFEAVMNRLCSTQGVRVVLLPRNDRQAVAIRQQYDGEIPEKIVIPERAVDGLNLVWHSDLVVSGGGTMNREAAALGVPVYSIFRGTMGAVDRNLEEEGRLIMLREMKEVEEKIVLQARDKSGRNGNDSRDALNTIITEIEGIVGR